MARHQSAAEYVFVPMFVGCLSGSQGPFAAWVLQGIKTLTGAWALMRSREVLSKFRVLRSRVFVLRQERLVPTLLVAMLQVNPISSL